MAQFALYRIKYDLIKYDDALPDLFPELEEKVDLQYSWDHRHEFLNEMLSADYGLKFVVHQTKKDVTYDHMMIGNPHNPVVYIIRFANNKETHLEKKFKDEKHIYNPSCLVFIDNREGVQRIAIQYSQSSFNSTKMVSKILEKVFNEHLEKKRLKMIIEPQQYSNQFWDITKRNKDNIEVMSFARGRCTEDVQTVTNLVTALDSTSRSINGKVKLSYEAEKGECLHLLETNEQLRDVIDSFAKNNLPVTLKTRDGVKFTCFMKNAPENMTVMENLNIPAKKLATLEEKDLFNLEIKEIVEFMNRMKLKYD